MTLLDLHKAPAIPRHADAVMTNLLGEDILSIPALLKNPDAHVHDYGKAEIKAGRKMGHVNIIKR